MSEPIGVELAHLRDGRPIVVRVLEQRDEDALVDFVGGLSDRTLATRMLGPTNRVDRDFLRTVIDANGRDRVVVCAFYDGVVIGSAAAQEDSTVERRAMMTFTVADGFQGKGIGSILLERLLREADLRGVRLLVADVLADNVPMIRLIESVRSAVLDYSSPITHVEVPIVIDAASRRWADHVNRFGVARSLDSILEPRSIALIGVGARKGTIGESLLTNIIGSFTGDVYVVNPYYRRIGDNRTFPTIAAVPDTPDLAVVAIRADLVYGIVEQCIDSGVRSFIVISSGLGRIDEPSTLRELSKLVHTRGARMVGPNCMGVVTSNDNVTLRATFSPELPPAGGVAMSSASGPLGLSILSAARHLRLGFASFVSLGDGIDVSSIDLLHRWERDRAVSTILLHGAVFGDPAKFVRVARRVAARKPIVALSAAHRSPSSLPQWLASITLSLFETALYRQTGIIRVETMSALFDAALLLETQPLPAGGSIAIISNADAPAELTESVALEHGLHPARAASVLPHHATPDDYALHLELLLGDDDVDSVVVVFVPPLVVDCDPVARAIVAAALNHPTKTVVTSFMGAAGLVDALTDGDTAVPSYRYPEDSARALAVVASYAAWRRHSVVDGPELEGVDIERARELIDRSDHRSLTTAITAQVLSCFGIDVASAEGPQASETDFAVAVIFHPVFGQILACGLNGAATSVFGDVAVHVLPLTQRDAQGVVSSLRGHSILAGPAGEDRHAVQLIRRVSALVDAFPDLTTVDLPRVILGGTPVAVKPLLGFSEDG